MSGDCSVVAVEDNTSDTSSADTMASLVSSSCVRWAFNASKWRPTREEWLLATRLVQKEEMSRINRFVFKMDAKLALVGRLLMRSGVRKRFPSVPYKDILFDRTDKGKPYLLVPTNDVVSAKPFDLNISHSGDYCVMGSVGADKVGVDVMRIEYSGQRNDRPVDDFFRLMNRQFSDSEWRFINIGADDKQRIFRFIRLWTLKESFVKAEGVGIAFDLKRISFQCPTPALQTARITVDTTIRVDGQQLDNWIFEESLLDADHCVCVAYNAGHDFKRIQDYLRDKSHEFAFNVKTITELFDGSVPLNANQTVEESLWTDFENKLIKKYDLK